MIAVDWLKELGWGEAQLEEMRLTGYGYVREGKWSDAIILFKALVVLDPLATYDWQTLGALYLQKGESKLALEAVERALELDPADEPTRLNQAKALLVLGRLEEGLLVAEGLTQAKGQPIAQSAEALLLAYSSASTILPTSSSVSS